MNSRRWPAWASSKLAFALTALVAAVSSAAPPDEVFRIDGQRPTAAVISAGEQWDRTLPLDTPMERAVAGVLAAYDAQTIAPLLRCATRLRLPEDAVTQRLAIVQLAGPDRAFDHQVELLRLDNGSYAARPRPDRGTGVLLDAGRFETLGADWPAYRGGFDGPIEPAPGAESAVLPRPYVAGAVTLDSRTQKRRLYRGMPVRTTAPDRVLDEETLHVRLPAGYDPRTPAGLVVWSSPTRSGSIPAVLDPALDELNLVCIGSDNTGNARDVPDKFQIVFDAIATARRRFHIDDRRIYIAGMSGGGKVASILATCFPEVFDGAVAIVGLASSATLDDTWGEHRQAYFASPRGQLLDLARAHRMALMSGPLDFNYGEMRERAARLEADGFANLRFFSYPDMAHVMPTADRFAEAMRWVDEPWQSLRAQEQARAASLLATYLDGREDPAPVTPSDQAALSAVIEAAPWSAPAWQALELRRTR